MIECVVLNKKIERSIVLVHGLFASAGFWLQYIHHFSKHRLLILDINYNFISDSDLYEKAVNEKLQSLSNGTYDAVIAHSMGAVIGRCINKSVRNRYFEICPVTISTRTHVDGFKDQIQRMTEITRNEIERQLQEASKAVENLKKTEHGDEIIYTPTTDKYFSYRAPRPCYKFDGDHFEIEEAVRNIAQRVYT